MSFAPHFPYSELITNGKHPEINNTPPDELIENGARLSWKLEQARKIWSKRLGRECHVRIPYGYRCKLLNKACGSVSKSSAHLEFSAADCAPEGLTSREAWDALRLDPYYMEDVDQLILERGIVHLGLPVKAHDFVARNELRIERPGPIYPLWAIWPAEGSD